MNTTNLISTPNITGNIGSCSTQVSWVYTDRTFWKINKEQIATNSCTGHVTTYQTYEYSGMAFGLSIGILIIIGVALVALADNF